MGTNHSDTAMPAFYRLGPKVESLPLHGMARMNFHNFVEEVASVAVSDSHPVLKLLSSSFTVFKAAWMSSKQAVYIHVFSSVSIHLMCEPHTCFQVQQQAVFSSLPEEKLTHFCNWEYFIVIHNS